MYELWAKKRPVEGRGFPYEFICSFTDENYKFTAVDKLDRDTYQEALVVRDHGYVFYVEFEKPMVYKKKPYIEK